MSLSNKNNDYHGDSTASVSHHLKHNFVPLYSTGSVHTPSISMYKVDSVQDGCTFNENTILGVTETSFYNLQPDTQTVC